MIKDAIGAELYKTLQHRTAVFWGFLAMPALSFLLGLAGAFLVTTVVNGERVTGARPLSIAVLDGLSSVQNPFWGLFWVLGGVILMTGDYRWSTWRFVLVRNGRGQVLSAKMLVFSVLAASSLLLFVAGHVLVAALANTQSPDVMLATGPNAGQLSLAMLASLLRLASLGALVALAAVVTRSMVAALVSVLVGLLGLVLLELQVLTQGPSWMVPALPGQALTLALQGHADLSQLACLTAWVLVPAGLAGLVFSRQDLSRE